MSMIINMSANLSKEKPRRRRMDRPVAHNFVRYGCRGGCDYTGGLRQGFFRCVRWPAHRPVRCVTRVNATDAVMQVPVVSGLAPRMALPFF